MSELQSGQVVERDGERYLVVGKTFSTKERVPDSASIVVECETLNVERDGDGEITKVSAWAPNFIERAEAEPDSLEAIVRRAKANGVLQEKIREGGRVTYLPTGAGEPNASKGIAGWVTLKDGRRVLLKPKPGSASSGRSSAFRQAQIGKLLEGLSQNQADIQAAKGIAAGGEIETFEAHGMIQDWNQASSYDDDPLQLQKAASRYFEVSQPGYLTNEIKERNPSATYSSGTYDAFVNSSYNLTQERLADLGLKPSDTIRVQRGVRLPTDLVAWEKGGIVAPEMNPLSSWTLDLGGSTSSMFAKYPGKGEQGYVLEMDIPIEYIVSLAGTGLGSISANEVIILGGADVGHQARVERVFQ